MVAVTRRPTTKKKKSTKTGSGLVNRIINRLPIELHIPGYQFCGPGTRLQKRLARGDEGINPLNAACREHDIVYSRRKGFGGMTRGGSRVSRTSAENEFSRTRRLSVKKPLRPEYGP